MYIVFNFRDKSIPSLDSLVFDDEEHSILSDLIVKQKEMESSYTEPAPKATEMLPPQPCTDFNTARLFLSHFGFLSRLDDTNVIILITQDISHTCFVLKLLTNNKENGVFRMIHLFCYFNIRVNWPTVK